MRLSRYREVGEFGDPYAPWMRDLRGERGVYVIRYIDGGEIAWVGHSTSDLRKTITRHFQAWGRESRSEHANYDYPRAGTYERDEMEVAVAVADDATPNDDVYAAETLLVCDLQPVDNTQKAEWCGREEEPEDDFDDDFDDDLDDAPF